MTSPKSQEEVNIASLSWLYPLPQSETLYQSQSCCREEVHDGKGFLLAIQFNYRCLGVCNVMDSCPSPVQGRWHPRRAASREELGFTTNLSTLPQDYWRERNAPEKISQLLLKGTAFSVPFWDSHS